MPQEQVCHLFLEAGIGGAGATSSGRSSSLHFGENLHNAVRFHRLHQHPVYTTEPSSAPDRLLLTQDPPGVSVPSKPSPHKASLRGHSCPDGSGLHAWCIHPSLAVRQSVVAPATALAMG